MNSLLTNLRRRVIEPVWAFYTGSPLLRYWREAEPLQFLSRDELLNLQWVRTRSILQHAYTHTTYYRDRFREYGVEPGDVKEPSDLLRLPILKKDDVRDSVRAMIASDVRFENLMQAQTGGSTGTALDIYYTEDCSERRNAAARRHDRWSGWEVGEPRGLVWVDFRQGFKEHLVSWAVNPRIHLNPLRFNREAVVAFAKEWKRVQPTLLTGHAHALYRLAEYAEEFGLDEIRPRGILSTVMTLMPHERTKIESVFGVKVIDRYGCEEVSLIACECEAHEGMHLNVDHLFVEFIADDGTPAKPGEPGKIVVTDLFNRAMPFIRYQVEDVGIPSDHRCSCGRGLPMMEKIVGRLADFLVRTDGSLIAGISLLDKTLLAVPGIKQMQIVQDALEQFRCRVVRTVEYGEHGESRLVQMMRKEFGDTVSIQVEYLDHIPHEPNGKYRFTISRVKNAFM